MARWATIGVQSQTISRAGLEWMIRANVSSFRAINDAHNPELLRELKAALPDCKIGLRLVDNVDLSRPEEEARRWGYKLARRLAEFPYDFLSGANETGYGDDAKAYSAFNVNLARMFNLGSASGVRKYGAFDWGVCWPALPRLSQYAPGWSAADFIAFHGYKLPNNEDANTIYHYKRVMLEAKRLGLGRRDIWLTEFGLDVQGRAGDGFSGPVWNWMPHDFAEWLRETVPTLTDVEHVILFLLEWTDEKWASWSVMHPEIQEAIKDLNAEARREEMKPIYVAICPSNQDRNVSDLQPAGFGRYNEAGGMAYLAGELREAAKKAGFRAGLLVADAESSDKPAGSLSGLVQQMKEAKAWLDATNEPGAIKCIVSIHTDSGTTPHTYGIHGRGPRQGSSRALAIEIAERVGKVFGHAGPQGVFSKMGNKDFNDYLFWTETKPYDSVLIELCSHQSERDLATLYQKPVEVASAIAEGIKAWAGQTPTPQPPDDWTIGQLREQLRVVTGERDALAAKIARVKEVVR